MHTTVIPRLDHLRRLTDPRGLIQAAIGGFPNRFSGYDAVDNADALRLCALASQSVEAEIMHGLARTYHTFLTAARREEGKVYHHSTSMGKWSDEQDDVFVQARLARALSAVIVSELPIKMRLSSANWWRELLPQADNVRVPVAAGQWLLALGNLRQADPARDLDRAQRLADWLVEDCYYAIRSDGWHWYDWSFKPMAASIPAGLWQAYRMLGESRYARVAEITTQFVVARLFESDTVRPVGTRGGWSCQAHKADFDQLPAEVCSIVELLQLAAQITGTSTYSQKAQQAARWFEGHNILGLTMIDPQEHGCYNALTAEGVDPHQGASAIVSYLLTLATMVRRSVVENETANSLVHQG